MRILMVSLPFTGHVNPMLGMAKALVDKGHEVDFILSNQWKTRIEQAGAAFIPYENFPEAPSELDLRRLSFGAACNTALKHGTGHNCLIYEMLFFPGREIADRLKIPAIRLFSTFALNDEILSGITKTGGPLMGLLKSKAIAKAMTRRLLGEFEIREDNLLTEITHNPPKLNFVFTTREFQIDASDFPEYQYKFLGPSIQGRSEPLFAGLDDLEEPLIYISLGSMLNNARSFYLNCIKAFADAPYEVIMSVGKKVDIADLGKLPHNIRVYSFVPQLQVLQKSSLFITHGGMNSVNEAIHFGVPMVVTPLATDQPTIAKRILELNLGRILEITAVSAQILKASVSVMNDQEIRGSMKRFMEYSTGAPGTEFAVSEIERFVRRERLKKRSREER